MHRTASTDVFLEEVMAALDVRPRRRLVYNMCGFMRPGALVLRIER